MESALDLLTKQTTRLVGELCWRVRLSEINGLSLDFGDPQVEVDDRHENQPRRVWLVGDWQLLVLHSWQAYQDSRLITHPTSTSLRVLEGQEAQSVAMASDYWSFVFDRGGELRVPHPSRTIDVRSSEELSAAATWRLFEPEGTVLVVVGQTHFTHKDASEPRNACVWRRLDDQEP